MDMTTTRAWLTVGVVAVLGAVAVLVFVLLGGDDEGNPAKPGSPTPSVTASATATATATPSPTEVPATPTPTEAPATVAPTQPPVSEEGQVIEHGPRGTTQVALTFDMGGRVEPALDIMNWLIRNQVKATIFMTGAMTENQNTEAGRQVLQLVDANPQLFALGNHSYSHPDFRDLTPDEIRLELVRTEQAMSYHVSWQSKPLFRPPFGGQNAAVVEAVAAAGYPYVVMWDVDTIDWRPEADGGPTAAQMRDKVLTNAQGGSIVLMHLGGFNTFEALPGMVAGLKERGFELVTMTEMLGISQ